MLFSYPLQRRSTMWRKIHNPNLEGENVAVLLFFVLVFEVTLGCWRKACWFPFCRTKCLFLYSFSNQDGMDILGLWFVGYALCLCCWCRVILPKGFFWRLDFIQHIRLLNSGLPFQGWVRSGLRMRWQGQSLHLKLTFAWRSQTADFSMKKNQQILIVGHCWSSCNTSYLNIATF